MLSAGSNRIVPGVEVDPKLFREVFASKYRKVFYAKCECSIIYLSKQQSVNIFKSMSQSSYAI